MHNLPFQKNYKHHIQQGQSLLSLPMARTVLAVFFVLTITPSFFIFPAPALAENSPSQLVPVCNTIVVNGRFTNPCGWTQLIQLAENVLNFMIYITVPIAAIAFAWAGWLYLSARGDTGQISKAHTIFLNVFIGIVIVLVGWLVVDIIFKELVDPDSYIPVLDTD